MPLQLAWERCVRTRSKAASCRQCVDACPTGAIDVTASGAIGVDLSKCTSCGLCIPACPTESFSGLISLDSYRVTPTPATAVPTPRCRTSDVPCVGALSTEELVVLARPRGVPGLSLESCEGCSGASLLSRRATEANAILSALGLDGRVKVKSNVPPTASTKAPTPAVSRRALLRRFLPLDPDETPKTPAAPPPPPTGRLELDPKALDIAKVRSRDLPPRRIRLLEALQATPAAKRAPVLGSEEVACSSMKQVDAATCTGCMACVNACPTGALTTTRHQDELRFDASRCVKCALCHDACTPHAITIAETFDPESFRTPRTVTLVRLVVRRCVECGEPFKPTGDATLCPRCDALDAEAHELAGFRRLS